LALTLSSGTVVNRSYRIERLLGRGAFGAVYLASHRFLGPQALKALPLLPDVSLDDLLKEARLLVDLVHPHVIRIYDADFYESDSDSFAYITMQVSTKGTLADLLNRVTKLPLTVAIDIAIQVAEALEFGHKQALPLLHRDVKTSNVLLFDEEGRTVKVKLADYGLATNLDAEVRLAKSGGTIAYAPPEMAWGIADERTDVYGLGVVLYRMVTGIHPFPLTTPEQLSVTRDFVQALSLGRRSILPASRSLMSRNDELDEVLAKALAFDMFDRFRSATDFRVALERLRESMNC
jgi:serine/threonine protein kinase